MLVRELIVIHYENRTKYLQGMKGQVRRIDENASVQTAQHTWRKNVYITVYSFLLCLYLSLGNGGLRCLLQ